MGRACTVHVSAVTFRATHTLDHFNREAEQAQRLPRALGEYKTEVDPGEAKGSDDQLDVRRLDKQGRGGQEN